MAGGFPFQIGRTRVEAIAVGLASAMAACVYELYGVVVAF